MPLLTGLCLYLVAINLLALLMFHRDKRRAMAGRRRVPESTLLFVAGIGGTVGAFAARRLFRHKTRKQPFSARLRLIAISQAVLLLGYAYFAASTAAVI